ncbi:2-polyprenyl-6-methoxyphenol hydroxylase-like FAD-dependent oxidoreductase [Sphingobacterium zeae]|uniref:2-polyprenyl-6-methoxyphenol hydroxylase-like FAD-dependent oxidoreductase n=1 Tax=Sphingobacterium zeae TaxID=1776859 RepID=A0ABU0U5T3_9SPHI|nr:FAD-dependent monooxygenase [Sphingobacterium zeae]MDQ1150315.1 2-polyprenyl-6-methoxyphenol hydroxylase-like FAD-dependent oxidoreductase [Sphingobacterium zeae]
MKDKKILVSGASIAGPTLAYWLDRYGFEVTVIERAAVLRLGGQNIDVKGPAKEIALKMGILEEIRAHNTTEIGLRFVSSDNHTIAEFPSDSSMSMTQELEILRGDLVKILYDLTAKRVEYIFGDHIIDLIESENEVKVDFASGKKGVFDIVVIAEGIGSATRDLAFGGRPRFNYLGLYTAYLTILRNNSDSRWARWYNAPKGIVFMLRPDNYGKTRASVTFLAKENAYKDLSEADQKRALIDRIQGAGWESERLVNEIKESEDLYFERVSQVKTDKWTKGRVVITGDAAWCATPIAGKGTDLALAGAYILAGELYRAGNYEEAFRNYEKIMKPYVQECQKLPPGIPRIVYPESRVGVALLNQLIAIVGSKPVKWLMRVFSGDKKDNKKNRKKEIILPDYE